MKTLVKLIPVVALASLVGCSHMASTEENVFGGAALGALGGAAIGAATGSVGTGALIGAGVGAVGGYMYDRGARDEYYYDYD